MNVRRTADWALRGLTFLCAAAWTVLFFTAAVGSMAYLFQGLEQGGTAFRAVVAREPCVALFERAGRTLLRFAVEFAMYVALAWAGVEMFRRSLVRKLSANLPESRSDGEFDVTESDE